MKIGVSASLTISLITFFEFGMAAPSLLLPINLSPLLPKQILQYKKMEKVKIILIIP